ncbi:MAG TPA: D-2-hydroxyacid dehydrogenase [Woeseiaceae bacterium]|nr:D-2-hydroxyacid dehydrogenase [Woeseiaceae bacterium]
MKAVFLDFATMGPGLDVSAMRALLPELEIFDNTRHDELERRIDGAGIVLTNKARFSGELLSSNPSLRLIGLTATGTDNVNLDAARKHGVAVCNIRNYCTTSVAEHVFGCLLSLAHNLPRYDAAVKRGAWQESRDFCLLTYPIRELSSMTLGIVGYGALGKGVARIAKAFGMTVIVSARTGTSTIADDRVAFDEVLERSDAISLHCPLTPATAGLFGVNEFEKMKSDAILINTARGGLIDSAALASALATGAIAGAAIDVLPEEPPVGGNPLLDYAGANLIITPHIAWATNEARQAAIDELVANVAAFLAGERRNRVI